MKAWFDCEFTDFEAPELLSLGIVAERGEELYVELLDAALENRSSAFVRDTVLPMFGLFYGARVGSYFELATSACAFLLGLNEPVELVFDYATDRDLLEHALEQAPRWPDLRDLVSWIFSSASVYYSDIAASTMEKVWVNEERDGLGRHHALSDARALRAVSFAVEGAGEDWWRHPDRSDERR